MPEYNIPQSKESVTCLDCGWCATVQDMTGTEQHSIALQALTAHLLYHAIKELKSLNLALP